MRVRPTRWLCRTVKNVRTTKVKERDYEEDDDYVNGNDDVTMLMWH